MTTPTKPELGPIDFTETRINGYHAYWPQDDDTQERLERMLEFEDSRSPSLVKPVLFGSLVLLGVFVVAYLILGE